MMQKTTVEVSKETLNELHELKEIFVKPSIDALIRELILIAKYQALRDEYE